MGFSSLLGTTSYCVYILAVGGIVLTSILISGIRKEPMNIVLDHSNSDSEIKGTTLHDDSNSDAKIKGTTLHDNSNSDANMNGTTLHDDSNSDAKIKGTTLHDNSNSDTKINGTTVYENGAPRIKILLPTTQRNGCSMLTKYSEKFDRQEVKHWQPDWFTSGDNIKIMLEKRRAGIIDRCSILKQCKSFRGQKKANRYEKEFLQAGKLLNCATYKAGYTFWNHMIQKLRKEGTTTAAMKFTVTRNPWHRLVSVWQDRLSGAHGNPTAVMKKFCRGKTWPSMPPFREFVEDCVLANWKFNQMNAHWAPVVTRCEVCNSARSFDFFLSQENLNKEASYMLRKLDVENVTQLLTTVQSQSLREGEGHRPPYQQFYKNVSSQTINELRQFYKYELYLFDYPDSPFVDFAQS